MGLGSEIQKKPDPDPGSGIKKAPDPGSATLRVGIKKPTQKNPPKKTQKNPPKKTH